MLIEYRDRIAPKVIGHRPDTGIRKCRRHLQSPSDGGVADNDRPAKRRAGIVLTPHQFRHLSAKVMLDAEPGEFRERVGNCSDTRITKPRPTAYAGIDSSARGPPSPTSHRTGPRRPKATVRRQTAGLIVKKPTVWRTSTNDSCHQHATPLRPPGRRRTESAGVRHQQVRCRPFRRLRARRPILPSSSRASHPVELWTMAWICVLEAIVRSAWSCSPEDRLDRKIIATYMRRAEPQVLRSA